MTSCGMPPRPPSRPWLPFGSAGPLVLVGVDGSENGSRLRDPTVSTTTGPALSVRLLPSRPPGSAGNVVPSLSAVPEAAVLLKVKDADPADMTSNSGWPFTSEGSLPGTRRCRPLADAAPARLVAVVTWGVCSTLTEP